MFERTKAIFGSGGRDKRYPDPESEYTPPQEIEDPHTTPDSTSMTISEFITRNSVSILSFLLLGVVVLGLIVVYMGTYFATFFGNIWVQRGMMFVAIASMGYFYGRSSQRAALKQRDVLVIYDPDSQEVTRFLGQFKKAEHGEFATFEPIKGFSRWGHNPEHYTLKEISPELAAKSDRDPSDTARIRLHPKFAATAATNTGRITVQLSAGLVPEPHGDEASLEASLPDIADESTVEEMKDELNSVWTELINERQKKDMFRRQRNDARKEAKKAREIVRKEIGDTMELMYPFASGMSGSVDEQTNGDGSNRADTDTLRRELMPDD